MVKKFLIPVLLLLVSVALASETIIERYGNGNVKHKRSVVKSGNVITTIDEKYKPDGSLCYKHGEKKKGNLLLSYETHDRGCPGIGKHTYDDNRFGMYVKEYEFGRFEYYANGTLKYSEKKDGSVTTIYSYDANGHMLYSIINDHKTKYLWRNNEHVVTFESNGNKVICSNEKQCEKIRKEKELERQRQIKQMEEERLAEKRAREEKERQAEILEQQRIKELQQRRDSFLAKFDKDGDGFCSGEGMQSDDVELFCEGFDACPELQGDIEGCTREAKLILDYDKDNDGFCDPASDPFLYKASQIYSENKNVFRGVDLCPNLSGGEYGCPKNVVRQWYENFKQKIREELDQDNDGFCSGQWYSVGRNGSLDSDEEIIYAYRYLHPIIKEKLNEIVDNVYYRDKSPYVHAFYSDKKILEAVHSVCKGYDECAREPGVAPNGCSAAYNSGMKRRQEDMETRRRNHEDSYQRDNVRRMYGQPDSDGDKICDPWVRAEGYEKLFADICSGVDKCPNEYAKTSNGCKGNGGSFESDMQYGQRKRFNPSDARDPNEQYYNSDRNKKNRKK